MKTDIWRPELSRSYFLECAEKYATAEKALAALVESGLGGFTTQQLIQEYASERMACETRADEPGRR